MTIDTWISFVAVFTALSLPLGPSAVTIMSVSAAAGLRRAAMVALGFVLAGAIHASVASVGFGALLLASAELFTAVKLAGAAYLAWLCIRMWRRPTVTRMVSGGGRPGAVETGPALVRRGVLVSLSNPKAVLSYMAIFPQFIEPALPLVPQLAVLMPTAAVIVFAVYMGYAGLAAPLGRWLVTARRQRWFNRAVAAIYGFCAAGLALSARR